jgi:membrane protein YqaA with SNARE-associated domain
MKSRHKNLPIWITQFAEKKWTTWALFLCCIADASFIPFPTSTFFLLLVTLNTKKVSEYIISGTLGIVSGALMAYLVGQYVWFNPHGEYTGFSQFLFNHAPGFSEDTYNKISILYTQWNFWLLCVAALTPIPYGIFAVFSGVFEINIFIFLFTTLTSHVIKFSLLALAALRIGEQFRKLSAYNCKPRAQITSVFIGIIILISNIFQILFQ